MAIPKVISKGNVLPSETKAYVDRMYKHDGLINDHPKLYLYEVFRHFEADFVAKGIGNREHSRWPQILQDLELLPLVHWRNRTDQDRPELSGILFDWQNRPESDINLETALPWNSQIQIPAQLVVLFVGVRGFVAQTNTIRYGDVVAAVQDFADNQYDINLSYRIANLKRAPIKKYRVRAFFGMTVFDRFLDAVEKDTGTALVIHVPRTNLFDPEPVARHRPPAEEVPPVPVQPRTAGPKVQPVQPQVANPTGGSVSIFSMGLGTNPIHALAMLNPGQVIAHQLLGQSTHLEVPQDTKNYINQLYANLQNLIHHEYPVLYIGELFLHFKTDFEKGIGTSNWPILLQDFGLLPERYHSTVTGDQVRSELNNAWHQWLPHLEAEPIGSHYHQTLVRVPPIMASVFRQVPAQQLQSGSIHYDYLVEEMQRYVNEYPVRDNDLNRSNNLQTSVDQKFRFLAIYYLTVIDQFVQLAAHMRALDGRGPLEDFHPRTELLLIVAGGTNAVPLPNVGPVAVGTLVHDIDRPRASGGGGGVRNNSEEAGASNCEDKRKSTDQGGGQSKDDKKGPVGSM